MNIIFTNQTHANANYANYAKSAKASQEISIISAISFSTKAIDKYQVSLLK